VDVVQGARSRRRGRDARPRDALRRLRGGRGGAARALQILGDELVRAMQLSGVRSVAEIGPDLLAN